MYLFIFICFVGRPTIYTLSVFIYDYVNKHKLLTTFQAAHWDLSKSTRLVGEVTRRPTEAWEIYSAVNRGKH
jgi:hypothetical protein